MRDPRITIALYIDDLRARLAAWIHPGTADAAEKYKEVLADIKDIETTFTKSIPEIQQAAEWLIGKNETRSENFTGNYSELGRLYPTYAKYMSLVHLKDVLVNDYKRKLKL